MDRHPAGISAEDKPNRDHNHIDDHHLLGVVRIQELHREVGRGNREKGGAKRYAEPKPAHAKHGRFRYRLVDIQIAIGERAVALLRMMLVALAIVDVVYRVARARDRTERDKGEDAEDDVVKMKEPLAKDERRKDQSVLEPLVGPRELDQRVPLGPLDSRYRAAPGQIHDQNLHRAASTKDNAILNGLRMDAANSGK